MNRRKARENVFYLVFETEFQKDVVDYGELLRTAIEIEVIEYDEYTERVFFGIMAERELIDSKIEACSNGWKLDRISKISIAIMRICVYEMLFCEDIPFNVSINEAVELAKKFDYEKAPSYINGVLNKIAENEGLKK